MGMKYLPVNVDRKLINRLGSAGIPRAQLLYLFQNVLPLVFSVQLSVNLTWLLGNQQQLLTPPARQQCPVITDLSANETRCLTCFPS